MTADLEPTSIADMAIRRAQYDPASPFVLTIDESAPHAVRTHTYGELLTRATVLAGALAEAGVSPGDRVGCYLSNSPSWVVASLAVWFNGAAVAAAGTLLPGNEASGLFTMADAKTVVTLSEATGLGREFVEIRIDEEGLLDGSDPGATGWDSANIQLPEPDDLAVAIFTSGTTGRPKGITHTHADLVSNARRVAAAYARTAAFRSTPAPPHLPPGVLFNPFGHMAGYSRLGFRMWTGRATVIVPRFTVAATKTLLDRFPMGTLQLTPTMIYMLATAEESLDLSAVKYVNSGTAPLPIATRDLFETRYGVPVMQAYGMSETGGVAQERFDDVVAGRRGPGSVGRIAAGVEVKFRHLDDDRPPDEGEILVRTDEASKEFIGGAPVPVDDDGWFATGDVGRLDDDILYITGRLQEKMIVGGFNVYPAEVEDAARRSPLVREAVVVGLPDDRLGERPVAGIVWEGEVAEDALNDALRSELAPYKVPREFFSLDSIPLTVRDKVDRRRAAELARSALGTDS